MSSASADPHYTAPIAPGLPRLGAPGVVSAGGSAAVATLADGLRSVAEVRAERAPDAIPHASVHARRQPTPSAPPPIALGWAPMAWRRSS